MASQNNKTSPKKPKLVRDSFTIPKAEFAAIDTLKSRAIALGTSVKKSELLRAGLMALQGLTDAAFKIAVAAVPTLKTGRPSIVSDTRPAAAPVRKAAKKAPAKAPARSAAKAAAKAPANSVAQPAAKAAVKTAAKAPAKKTAAKPASKTSLATTPKAAAKRPAAPRPAVAAPTKAAAPARNV